MLKKVRYSDFRISILRKLSKIANVSIFNAILAGEYTEKER